VSISQPFPLEEPENSLLYPKGHTAYENDHRLEKEIADSSARKLIDYSQRPDKIPMMLVTSRDIWSVDGNLKCSCLCSTICRGTSNDVQRKPGW